LTSRSANSRTPSGSGAGAPELLRGREPRAVGRQKCDLARQAEIDRAARLGLRDLQRPADDQAGIVLVFEPVIPLHVLTHDAVLVGRLLHPEMAAVARAAHRARKGDRGRAGGDQHRQAGMACGMNGTAVVLGADVHMHGGRRHPPAHRRVTERRVEGRIFVRHHDELGRRPAERVRLGDRLLHEHDFRAGIEEHVVDATEAHGGDDGVAALVGRNAGPIVGLGARHRRAARRGGRGRLA
jgi:hypothetical protein